MGAVAAGVLVVPQLPMSPSSAAPGLSVPGLSVDCNGSQAVLSVTVANETAGDRLVDIHLQLDGVPSQPVDDGVVPASSEASFGVDVGPGFAVVEVRDADDQQVVSNSDIQVPDCSGDAEDGSVSVSVDIECTASGSMAVVSVTNATGVDHAFDVVRAGEVVHDDVVVPAGASAELDVPVASGGNVLVEVTDVTDAQDLHSAQHFVPLCASLDLPDDPTGDPADGGDDEELGQSTPATPRPASRVTYTG
ncbi:MAG: hypothetical protein AB7L84_10570 [Acidimicrobiia bacterium]